MCFHCTTSKVWFGFLGLCKPKQSNETREFSLNSQLRDQDVTPRFFNAVLAVKRYVGKCPSRQRDQKGTAYVVPSSLESFSSQCRSRKGTRRGEHPCMGEWDRMDACSKHIIVRWLFPVPHSPPEELGNPQKELELWIQSIRAGRPCFTALSTLCLSS